MPNPSRLDPKVEKSIQQLIRAYRNTKQRLDRQLNRAALTDFQRFRISEQRKQLQSSITALNALARNVSKETIDASYQHGANITQFALDQQGHSIPQINLGNRLHSAAVGSVTQQMVQDLVEANGTLERSAERILRRTQQLKTSEERIQKLIQDGLIEGQTRRKTSERLRKRLINDLDQGTKILVNGRRFDPAKYSELVARTMTREAVTEGAIQSGLEAGVTLVQWSVHTGACPVCQQYQGKVYSATGRSQDGFPPLEVRPPAHPNCGHVLIPFVKEAFTEKELDSYRSLSRKKAARVHDHEDYQRVLKGGTAHRKAKDFDEDSKRIKRQRRERKRQGVDSEELVTVNDSQERSLTDLRDRVKGKSYRDTLEETRSAIRKQIRDAEPSPFTAAHGMRSDKQMHMVRFENLSVHFEPDLEDAAARTIAEMVEDRGNPIPRRLQRTTGRMILTQDRNKDDPYWAREYNSPGFVSAATGGDGDVVIYNGGHLGKDSVAHEMGHNIATQIYGSPRPKREFGFAIRFDGPNRISEYARVAPAEDFAESVRAYVVEPDLLRRVSPARYDVIHRLMTDQEYQG